MNSRTNPLNYRQDTSLVQKPEFFPLPQRGTDPFFGLARSSYYDLERRGLLLLARVRKPGNTHGKVLVPYSKMLALMERFTGGDSCPTLPHATNGNAAPEGIRTLADRYATPLAELEAEVATLAARVDAHLKKMESAAS